MKFKPELMDITYKTSLHAPRIYQSKIAATLVYRNRTIICTCTNVKKTHPLQSKYSSHPKAVHLHAENHCIVTALRQGLSVDDLSKCSLYIARTKLPPGISDDVVDNYIRALAMPCEGCTSAIVDFRINTVFYTTDTGIEKWTRK